jgi:hypothetical protein
LKQENRYQPVRFDPQGATHVMLRMESNWGGSYVEVGDVKLYAGEAPALWAYQTQDTRPEVTGSSKVISWTSQFSSSKWAAVNILKR